MTVKFVIHTYSIIEKANWKSKSLYVSLHKSSNENIELICNTFSFILNKRSSRRVYQFVYIIDSLHDEYRKRLFLNRIVGRIEINS